jgi:hypothetical protein
LAACSPLTLKTIPDGRLIVLYNHAKPFSPGAFFPRTPLVYAVSSDSGKTWGPPIVVDDEGAVARDREHGYPSVCFTDEGVLVVYSTEWADPQGGFPTGSPEERKIGGAKRCILKYPK